MLNQIIEPPIRRQNGFFYNSSTLNIIDELKINEIILYKSLNLSYNNDNIKTLKYKKCEKDNEYNRNKIQKIHDSVSE